MTVVALGRKVTIYDADRELLLRVFDAEKLVAEALPLSQFLSPLAGLGDPRSVEAAKGVLLRAFKKLDKLGAAYFIKDLKIERDDETPGWSYAVIEFELDADDDTVDHVWDEVARAAYKGVDPSHACRILVALTRCESV